MADDNVNAAVPAILRVLLVEDSPAYAYVIKDMLVRQSPAE